MTSIAVARSVVDLEGVRSLLRAFTLWHRALHRDDIALIDRYFDEKSYEEELASLPGKYAPPAGRLLIAIHEQKYAGCVALRDLGNLDCEMKRMFVYPEYHGLGIGRALGDAVLSEARAIGYRRILLDTSHRQTDAIALYRKLGFTVRTPYYDLPDDLRAWLVFMEKYLTGSAVTDERYYF